MSRKTWFITGASSGFGRQLTELLLERGDCVAATSRRPEQLADLAARCGEHLWTTELDVTDTAAIRRVIDRAFSELGRIDVVVSNAGYGLFGAAEEYTDKQILDQINTNLIGSIQLTRAALPHLRAQGGGRIIQLSSMGGQMAFPGMSMYHATKWAIEGFFEAVIPEVAPFGIQVTLVEPGSARTSFGSNLVQGETMNVYGKTPVGDMRLMFAAGQFPIPGDPARMARAIIAAADAEKAPRRLTLGSDAYQSIHTALSTRLAELEAQQDLAFSTDADDAAPLLPGTTQMEDPGPNTSESLKILVVGATGTWGGEIARLLLKKGHRVRALTRRPESPAAVALKGLGVEIVSGDLEDRSSCENAARGVDAIFAMATPFEAGIEAEVRQGVNMLEAAAAEGVKHLVYFSNASADQATGIPFFDSKFEIEQQIEASGIPYTIVGPVYFMENLFSMQNLYAQMKLPGLAEGKLAMPLPPGRLPQQIAVEDFAAFVVLALENRDRFLGKRIDIAGDEVTGDEAAATLSRAMERKIQYVELPPEQRSAMGEGIKKLLDWFVETGYSVDIDTLRKAYPEVGWSTYAEWANAQDWGARMQSVRR